MAYGFSREKREEEVGIAPCEQKRCIRETGLQPEISICHLSCGPPDGSAPESRDGIRAERRQRPVSRDFRQSGCVAVQRLEAEVYTGRYVTAGENRAMFHDIKRKCGSGIGYQQRATGVERGTAASGGHSVRTEYARGVVSHRQRNIRLMGQPKQSVRQHHSQSLGETRVYMGHAAESPAGDSEIIHRPGQPVHVRVGHRQLMQQGARISEDFGLYEGVAPVYCKDCCHVTGN